MALYGAHCVDGFWTNAYSEVFGLVLSVPVAVLVVTTLLDRRETNRWQAVQDHTGRVIETLAQQAAVDFHLALSSEERRSIPSPAVMPHLAHGETLRRLSRALRQRGDDADRDPAVLRLQSALGQPMHHLIDGLGSSIYASGDPELVRRFGVVRDRWFEWQRDRYLYEDEHPEQLWTQGADLSEALADLVGYAHRLVDR